jgi:hypothetical protein
MTTSRETTTEDHDTQPSLSKRRETPKGPFRPSQPPQGAVHRPAPQPPQYLRGSGRR